MFKENAVSQKIQEKIQKPQQANNLNGEQTPEKTKLAREKSKSLEHEPTTQYSLENLPQTSRYKHDFEEIGPIGEGGFGKVYKARHKLDGNIYAIKKIKLQKDMNSEENKKIRREITYLSGLNNRYIVRYFQTWVEREIDPNIIAEFADEGSEYYDEEESSEDSFEMKTDAHDTINTS